MDNQFFLLVLPIEILQRIFDFVNLEFEDIVNALHAGPIWRNHLITHLWTVERLQLYRQQVPLLNVLGDEDFDTFLTTYHANTPFVFNLHNPSVELINTLERFGSRLHQYHICKYEY